MKLICKITDSDFGLQKKKCVFRERRAARAVVLNKNKTKISIMDMPNLGFLSLPGGGIEKNESINDALIREVKEETGCEIKILKELGKIEEKRTHSKLHQISYCFLVVATKKGKPQFTEEEIESGTKLIWLPINKVISKLKNSKNNSTKDYDGNFVTKRTIAIVEEALKQI
jgi:8-oxo-dGTP diphosphatase